MWNQFSSWTPPTRHILELLKVENFWSQNIVQRNMEQVVDYYIFVQNLKNKD